MLESCIPVYWGNPEVGKDFNSNSFIQVNRYANYEAAIERIIELDKNEDQYLQMAMQPCFQDNQLPQEFSNESLEAFFDFVVSDMKTKPPVAASTVKASLHKLQLFKGKIQNSIYHRLGIHTGFR
ncbi:MAG: hypothetical protein GXC73_13140 [Chitinophagaceae bacterium]|nr:hypothetical protein [Chitinophagaceae bacterium]